MEDETQVRTVSELTRSIRETLEGEFGTVWVEGEISNHRLQSSGHQYFTLKDAGAQISCVFFRGMASRSRVQLDNGQQIQVQGDISVYEPRGQYQLVVKRVQAKGQGALQAQFEALKRRLHEEGLFDEERKVPIPTFPSVVALVTSPTGAAIRDMIHVLTRRAPWVRVLVYPVKVQGPGAAEEIAAAVTRLNGWKALGIPCPDTIVVGRGGGSLEDLWAFNEEAVARAIASSTIPVVSAVGHEIDFTISDFVSDLRAPTPSAAAELLAPDSADLRRQLNSFDTLMQQRIRIRLDRGQQVLDLTASGPLTHVPERLLMQADQEIDEMQDTLEAWSRLARFWKPSIPASCSPKPGTAFHVPARTSHRRHKDGSSERHRSWITKQPCFEAWAPKLFFGVAFPTRWMPMGRSSKPPRTSKRATDSPPASQTASYPASRNSSPARSADHAVALAGRRSGTRNAPRFAASTL